MTTAINREYSKSWDSMEGVPEWPENLGARIVTSDSETGSSVQRNARKALAWLGTRAAGLLLATILAFLADHLADWLGTRVLGYQKSPITGIPLAIILGLVICNGIGIPQIFQDGLRMCIRHLLRFAIVLLGFRLSLGTVSGIGLNALPVVLLCVATALILVPVLGKMFGLPRRLATLIAVGTGICGVSAIVATAPTIDAEEDEISYAVACVTIFGMTAMLFYPLLSHWLFSQDLNAAGIFLGTAIHDTSQVAGAALAYQESYQAPQVLDTATVVKLMRNLSMAAVIPLMAVLYHRGERTTATARPWHHVFPLFVIGFLAMTLLRTLGDSSHRPFGSMEPAQWHQFLSVMDKTSTTCLSIVMAAIGLSTGLARLRKLGMRPFVVGLSAALLVGFVSYASLKFLHAFGFFAHITTS